MLASRSTILAGSSLRAAASSASRVASVSTKLQAPLAQAARRQMTTKAERWDASTPAAAKNLLEGGSGAGSLNLKEIVPQIEARWKDLAKEEQYAVFRQLEELQKKDWKELSVDEKKAGESSFPLSFRRRHRLAQSGRREGQHRVHALAGSKMAG